MKSIIETMIEAVEEIAEFKGLDKQAIKDFDLKQYGEEFLKSFGPNEITTFAQLENLKNDMGLHLTVNGNIVGVCREDGYTILAFDEKTTSLEDTVKMLKNIGFSLIYKPEFELGKFLKEFLIRTKEIDNETFCFVEIEGTLYLESLSKNKKRYLGVNYFKLNKGKEYATFSKILRENNVTMEKIQKYLIK